MVVRSHHRDEGQRTAVRTVGSFKSAVRQVRFRDSMGKKERCFLLCEVRDGSYSHSGARRMGKGNQREVDEACRSLVESPVGTLPGHAIVDADKGVKRSYKHRGLEEVRRCCNKKLTVTRELLERFRSLKEHATLWKEKSFQYVSDVPGMAYNPFVNEEARD